ncbi:hypothetical protein B6V00_02280 [ANME-1 cluster archaeon ex4572_4]|nr:MAG: hypothetical protein B6V00_02280 [ANME-1 cluster archaeon ex4572_4]
MATAKRIQVSSEVWEELSGLKGQEQTFDELFEEMIEKEKKTRLLKEMRKIEETAEFVEI